MNSSHLVLIRDVYCKNTLKIFIAFDGYLPQEGFLHYTQLGLLLVQRISPQNLPMLGKL